MQGEAPLRQDRASLTMVHRGRREQAQSRVVVFVVVPGKEVNAEGAALVVGRETFGELRPVFEGFELRLAVVFVVGYPWPGMRSDATAWTVVPSVVEQVAEHYRGIAVDGSR